MTQLRLAPEPRDAQPDDGELIRLRAVVAVGRAIGVEHDLHRLCDRVLATCCDLIPAARGAITIYQGPIAVVTVARGQTSEGAPFAGATSVVEGVMATHEPYLRTEVDNDLGLASPVSRSHGVRSVIAVPLRHDASEPEWLGVILLDTAQAFRPRDLDVLVAIADPAARAIKTAMVVRRIEVEERERHSKEAHRDRVALIGQLAGGVAHDFNNLLHVILTCASMLEEALEHLPELLDDARQISHAATSAAELTRQLLTFSRRELVTPKVVDVPTVVSGMEKLLMRALSTQVELRTTIGPRIPPILIERSQLEQIVMNLVVNARDATLGRGHISLSVTAVELDAVHAAQRFVAPGRYVAIEVADHGGGIAPAALPHVFEPYFTTKASGKGAGLGLATLHGIVQQARGDISVESILGTGTTFRVFLPATDQAYDDGRPAASTTAAGTILVVDDDGSVRRVTERILRAAGYRILSASSGQQALTVAREHVGTIDLLLTDVVMPAMSGSDLAREFGHVRPTTRVIFMSGYHQQTPIGNAQFLAKPFNRTELLDKLRDVLARESRVLA